MRIVAYKRITKKEKIAFLTLALAAVICIFAVIQHVNTPLQQQGSPESGGSGHSVKWMGVYVPWGENTYPDYYVCINDLRDNIQMQIAIQINNQENSGYYFKIEPSGSPPLNWTITPMTMGYIDVDEMKTFAYNGASRVNPWTIPEGLKTEQINLVVKAFYDSGYTQLYSQDNFNVTFHFIDRKSGWTILYNDNFDNWSTQGWGREWNYWGGSILYPTSEFYTSFPCSLKLSYPIMSGTPGIRTWLVKTFTWENYWGYSEAYFIFSFRTDEWRTGEDFAHYVKYDDNIVFHPGLALTPNRWFQFAVPWPVDNTTTVRIFGSTWMGPYDFSSIYIDSVYVIAR